MGIKIEVRENWKEEDVKNKDEKQKMKHGKGGESLETLTFPGLTCSKSSTNTQEVMHFVFPIFWKLCVAVFCDSGDSS